MVGDLLVKDDTPDTLTILEALHNGDCRAILSTLKDARTARELFERCEIHRSTLYRKIDQVSKATLVQEDTEIKTNGSHANCYQIDFEEIILIEM